MQNLPPHELHCGAAYLSGRHKPLYMMEGLDSSYQAIFFVSYHAAAGTAGVLSHTYNPRAIAQVRINGSVAGESGINALVALAHGVPIVLITGDQYVGPELRPFCPDAEVVQVKDAIGRTAARSLHPDRARALIRDGAERALRRLGSFAPPVIELPARLEIDFRTEEMAQLASTVGERSERTGPRTTTITDDDPLRLYRTFATTVYLIRTLAQIH